MHHQNLRKQQLIDAIGENGDSFLHVVVDFA